MCYRSSEKEGQKRRLIAEQAERVMGVKMKG